VFTAMQTAPAISGAALRAAREDAGLSQNELARRLGMTSGQRISLWERGLARPRTRELLHAAARAVGVPARSLLVAPEDGLTLRWLRFAAGVSVPTLAAAVHVSAVTVRRWEAGSGAMPSGRTVAALARALRVPTADVRAALDR